MLQSAVQRMPAWQPTGPMLLSPLQSNLDAKFDISAGDTCRAAAKKALLAYNGYMQIGGGINPDNAAAWLDSGASHVIATSYIFQDGELNEDRLKQLVGSKIASLGSVMLTQQASKHFSSSCTLTCI